jgi:hypothetical protein
MLSNLLATIIVISSTYVVYIKAINFGKIVKRLKIVYKRRW